MVQYAGSMLRAESGVPCIAKQAQKLPMYQELGEDSKGDHITYLQFLIKVNIFL